jgi:hypothetical protein
MRLPMSRLGKVALVLLVLALVVVVVGLPIGMPMASCPQCVLPAGLACVLAVILGFGLVAPARSGERAGWLAILPRARLWAAPIEHPPQALP